MPDVFLSYSREDAAFVARLADALQAAGYSCWWDRQLVSGVRYLTETEEQLQAARAVVVVWSRTSITSHWVADEAAVGRDGNRLAALSFDGSMPPLGFRQFQVTDFAGWRGRTDEPAFQSLLGGLERLVAPHRNGASAVPAVSSTRPGLAQSPSKVPRRRLAVLLGLGAVLTTGLLWAVFRQTPTSPDTTAATSGQTTTAPAAAEFPRDPDLRRAFGLTQQLNVIREDVLLAEEIATRVVERSPADPEAVTVMAHVQAVMLLRNFEFTAERTAKARRYCERAVMLSPQDPVALSALAIFLAFRGNEPVRAERLAREATALAPLNPWPWRVLHRIAADPAKAVIIGEQNVLRFPKDALARYQLALTYRDLGRRQDFERALDETIALAPVGNAIDWRARNLLLRGDFAAARSALEQVPERLRGEERSVLTAFVFGLFAGDADYGLAALERYPESWFYGAAVYRGPKALLQAVLLQRAGRGELARDRFDAAVRQIREYRAQRPDDPSTHNEEAFALVGLGRLQEARAAHRVAMQLLERPAKIPLYSISGFGPFLRSLLVGDREGALQLAREYAEDPASRRSIRERFALDPRLAPFRNDRELLAILAEPKNP